ncbi:hypothetical protein HBP99_04140 [Listeria booriae]|uniref:hypothetical protein n=1 Tax=Listeria booriae TaxID=1552123 RepID=UPI001629B33F|nr:hypothetical protein [Listeria booriae]MBC2367810.1 hypothetical protein [Listeria booriae]
MSKHRKKPRSINKRIQINGVTFMIVLWGYTRKRVFIEKWYYEQVGGLEGWETVRVYDETFESQEEASSTANDFYLNPQKIIDLTRVR